MGYYRKGHFRKDGKWVSGHYVRTFGTKRRKGKTQGCAVIFFGGVISLLLFLLK
ncbi:hypothetical protein [Chryseobacterium shandongense]|uniref:hypothetical protein n=1 Tax=Chryseobacterium shandongense TaxID=1493872 RepID=UPI0013DDB2AC|nr:hypothetical protein [Chryseobacterium shandongense]